MSSPPFKPPPLLGISAIARRLGLTRQRVHVLVERFGDDFPKPVHELPTGRVWAGPDVEQWIAANPRYDHTAERETCPTCGQVVA